MDLRSVLSGTVLQGETVDRRTETAAGRTEPAAADAQPSTRVIEAVAAADDVDPLAMDPLYDVIDPDALDRLVEGEIGGFVQFAYAGHDVTVHGDGAVVVDGQEDR